MSTDRYYTPTRDDIGYRLKFVWIPVTIMGVRGEVCTFISKDVVIAGMPTAVNVTVERINKKDARLLGKGQYVGGEEGQSMYVWRRLYPASGRKEALPTPILNLSSNCDFIILILT